LRRLQEDKSKADFLLDFHQVQKENGSDKSTGLFPELALEELVFLCHKYYFIFLLQQEASSALRNTVVTISILSLSELSCKLKIFRTA
jgi:hypothetical protein